MRLELDWFDIVVIVLGITAASFFSYKIGREEADKKVEHAARIIEACNKVIYN